MRRDGDYNLVIKVLDYKFTFPNFLIHSSFDIQT